MDLAITCLHFVNGWGGVSKEPAKKQRDLAPKKEIDLSGVDVGLLLTFRQGGMYKESNEFPADSAKASIHLNLCTLSILFGMQFHSLSVAMYGNYSSLSQPP